jgi:hypothetical protein
VEYAFNRELLAQGDLFTAGLFTVDRAMVFDSLVLATFYPIPGRWFMIGRNYLLW